MNSKIRPTWILAAIILVVGLYSAFVRFFLGLGASTHLSDQFAWGLWIGFDVLCGVALAAGAFTLSAAVYVFHLDKYRPLVRPAILTGFIGYILAILGLIFDLGHPYRIWHPLIMWNPRSVMFEIAWCVTLYTSVLAMEVSIFFFEKVGWKKMFNLFHSLVVPLVIVGVILSTLHQSSLGSLFLIVPYKLHPFWYSPLLPIFFFISALSLGCAMVILESSISSKAYNKELELDLLTDLSRVLLVALIVYGMARFIDLNDRNVWPLLDQRGFERNMFLAEIIMTTIGPVALLFFNRIRINRSGLFIVAIMVVCGFILNRFNVSMTGLIRESGTKYIPSWMELSVSISLVTVGLIMFALAVKYMDIFKEATPCLSVGQTCRDMPSCCLPTALWALIILLWAVSLSLIGAGVSDFRKFQPELPGQTIALPSGKAIRY